MAPLPDGTLMVGSNETTRAGQTVSYALARVLTRGQAGVEEGLDATSAGNAMRLRASSRPGGRATLEFELPESGHVTLTLCDVTGRRVADFSADALAAGAHAIPLEAIWGDRRRLPAAGIYQAILLATCGQRQLRASTRVVHLR